MKYKKIECKDYNIHFIQNKGLHTIDVSVQFTGNVDRETFTYHNVLVDVMTYATKKYDTNKKIIRKSQEIYALRPVAYVARFGNLLNTRFNISVLNSRYIDEDNFKSNILLLKEIILNPLVKDNSFSEENVQIVKKFLYANIEAIKENPRVYASYNMYKEMDKDANYTLTRYCDKEILDKLTGKSLYEYYLKMIKTNKIDIFVAGDIVDEQKVIDLIKENFIFKKEKVMLADPVTYHKNKKDVKEVVQKLSYQQSKLCMGYKIFNATKEEVTYVLPLLDCIIGNSSDSLLMRYVREENSLCYYVLSYHNKLDNLLIVESAIEKESYSLACELIEKVFQMVQKGKFSNTLLKRAKTECLVNLDMIEDTNRSLINYYFGIEVLKSENKETRKEKIKAVTKDDIIKLVEKIHLDTIFFLEGEL